MRIGLITTLNTNIGDDFIREGICLVLQKIFPGRRMEFVPINKHRPLTVYPVWHPCHWTEWLPKGRLRLYPLISEIFHRFGYNVFESCDLIVQCGAPVIWPGCHKAEWVKPLWRDVVGRLYTRIPVLNLAAGSCFPWEEQPASIQDPDDKQYLQAILGYCRLTTARDDLARNLCVTLGKEVPQIICSAFLAASRYGQKPSDNGPILINYMQGGGHYWHEDESNKRWLDTVRDLIRRLQTRYPIRFLCHNRQEYDLAAEVDPTLPRIWPKNPQEYFASLSDARVALCNRMHASVGLASLGIPSIAVGTDTRLLMVAALGLPCLYVKEVGAPQLEDELESLLISRHQERERLFALQQETMAAYVKEVSQALGRKLS